MFIQVEAMTTASIEMSGSWSHCCAGRPMEVNTSLRRP
ncbi:hypothetical protein SGLAM104S_09044 [Streptomyces glaucescens]